MIDCCGVLSCDEKNRGFYILVMIILIEAVWWVHFRVSLTSGALWALSVWGLAHMMGGLLPLPDGWPYDGEHQVFYSLWLIPDKLKYDQIVHAYKHSRPC